MVNALAEYVKKKIGANIIFVFNRYAKNLKHLNNQYRHRLKKGSACAISAVSMSQTFSRLVPLVLLFFN